MKQKLKKYITSKLDLIISAKLRCSKSVEHYFPTGGSLTQKFLKNIQFSEGGQPPLKVIIFRNGFYHVISHPENPPYISFELVF